MSTTVFGAKIKFKDYQNPMTADASIGLYGLSTSLSSSVNQGAYTIGVSDIKYFEVGDPIYLRNAISGEQNFIKSINGSNISLGYPTSVTLGDLQYNNVVGGSEIRVIQNGITNLQEVWKSDLLSESGIDSFDRNIDLSNGGNIASPGRGEISLANYNQINKKLSERNVNVNGALVKIYSFLDNSTKNALWCGTCEEPSYDTKVYKIPLAGGLGYKRLANVSSYIDQTNYPLSSDTDRGKTIPISIGSLDYAKFVRTAKQSEVQVLSETITEFPLSDLKLHLYLDNSQFGNVSVFPVVGANHTNGIGTFTELFDQYYVQIAYFDQSIWQRLSDDYWYLPTDAPIEILDWKGKFLRVVDGSKNVKSARKILKAEINYPLLNKWNVVIFHLAAMFEEDLIFNEFGNAEGNALVQIVDEVREFQCDTWSMKAFVDKQGTPVTSSFLDLYSFTSQKSVSVVTLGVSTSVKETDESYVNIPQFSYLNKDTSKNNIVDLSVSFYQEDPDTIDAFNVESVDNLAFITDNSSHGTYGSLYNWGFFDNYKYRQDGFYSKYSMNTMSPFNQDNFVYTTDNKITTAATFGVIGYNDAIAGNNYYIALQFDLPKIDYDYDKVYLGLSNVSTVYHAVSNSSWNDWSGSLLIKARKSFVPASTLINISATVDSSNPKMNIDIDDMPDKYYVDLYTDFFMETFFHAFSNKPSGGLPTQETREWRGYKTFELRDLSDTIKYNCITKMGLFIGTDRRFSIVSTLYSLFLIFARKISVKNEIYSALLARIFNNTWNGRKNINDQIITPIDVLEHFCRLQNGSENDYPSLSGWGKSYWNGAKIKLSGDGSFDDSIDPNMLALKTAKCSRQIFNFNDAYTDKIKRTLCRNFNLANWVDENGNECIRSINTPLIASTDLITISNIIDRQSITITEAQQANIFPEPFVRYNKNYATDTYESIIQVTNTDYLNPTDAQKKTFVQIPEGFDAVIIWDKCHQLMLKSLTIEKPASDLTDLDWVRNDQEAVNYLNNWIDRMLNPTIEFNAHFNKVGTWQECHRFKLQLPFHTNNLTVECMLVSISINPNLDYVCKCKAIIYATTAPEGFDFSNWQDSFRTYAERSEGNDDVQDEYNTGILIQDSEV